MICIHLIILVLVIMLYRFLQPSQCGILPSDPWDRHHAGGSLGPVGRARSGVDIAVEVAVQGDKDQQHCSVCSYGQHCPVHSVTNLHVIRKYRIVGNF